MSSYNIRVGILVLISVAAVVALLFTGPIPQDPAYHLFADARRMLGIPNFWNVASNLPFLAAGWLGFARFRRLSRSETAEAYLVMCTAIVLVAFGSAYYHLDPSNSTLLWDRLPITVAFMALFSLLLTERIFRSHYRFVLWILVAAGAAAAIYWYWSETQGHGDLRPYALVQFLPLVLIPLILLMFRQHYLNGRLLIYAIGLYAVAKAFEHWDPEVFSMLGEISGHTIKHFAAAFAIVFVIYAVPVRDLDLKP